MITELIRSLYDYSVWANRRVLDTAVELSEDQFLDNVGPSHGSLRNTFVHTMSGQWLWLERWQGTSPPAMMSPADFPDLASIRIRWEEIENDTLQYLERLEPEQLEAVLSYTTTEGTPGSYPLWQVILHQANHQTQHRSEAAVMLTNFGLSPGDLDLVVYLSVLKAK
ncbi:MAG: DinB family protein [Anaerolineales bacterium]